MFFFRDYKIESIGVHIDKVVLRYYRINFIENLPRELNAITTYYSSTTAPLTSNSQQYFNILIPDQNVVAVYFAFISEQELNYSKDNKTFVSNFRPMPPGLTGFRVLLNVDKDGALYENINLKNFDSWCRDVSKEHYMSLLSSRGFLPEQEARKYFVGYTDAKSRTSAYLCSTYGYNKNNVFPIGLLNLNKQKGNLNYVKNSYGNYASAPLRVELTFNEASEATSRYYLLQTFVRTGKFTLSGQDKRQELKFCTHAIFS